MKTKTKIATIVTAVTLTSLMITSYHTQPTTSPVLPQIATVSEVVEMGKAYTPTTATKPIVAEEIAESSTQKEEITVHINQQEDIANIEETASPQPTEKEESTNTTLNTTQKATKTTTPTQDIESTPNNGDTRIINSQQQGYLIGFGWVDNMGENECTIVGDMYENGNKVGTMGDINKIVGSMD